MITATSVTDQALLAADVPAAAVAPPALHATAPEGRRLVLLGLRRSSSPRSPGPFGVDPYPRRRRRRCSTSSSPSTSSGTWPSPSPPHGGPGTDLLAADVGLDDYTPRVAVLVGCKNEELVVDGMVTRAAGAGLPGRPADPRRRRRRLRRRHRRAAGRADGRASGTCGCCTAPPGAGGGKSGALNAAAAHRSRRDPRHLRRRPRSRAATSSTGWCGTSRTRRSARCRAGASCATRRTPSWPARSSIDYFSGYLVNEYGRQALFELPAYGGANCAVRASTLRALGGWNPRRVTEDTDLTLRVAAARRAGALRHHGGRHRGGRDDAPPVLAPALPLGPRAPAGAGATTGGPCCAPRT